MVQDNSLQKLQTLPCYTHLFSLGGLSDGHDGGIPMRNSVGLLCWHHVNVVSKSPDVVTEVVACFEVWESRTTLLTPKVVFPLRADADHLTASASSTYYRM